LGESQGLQLRLEGGVIFTREDTIILLRQQQQQLQPLNKLACGIFEKVRLGNENGKKSLLFEYIQHESPIHECHRTPRNYHYFFSAWEIPSHQKRRRNHAITSCMMKQIVESREFPFRATKFYKSATMRQEAVR
jgi:hypothetical protein